MKHYIRLSLRFDKEASCKAILKTALDHFKNAETINPGTPYEEKGIIIVEDCYHDEHPTHPCIVTEFKQTP